MTSTAPLTDSEFAAVAGHTNPTRVDVDTMSELMSAPSGSRPRGLALWHDQVVSVRSQYHVDQYRDDARAWWVSGLTAVPIRRA